MQTEEDSRVPVAADDVASTPDQYVTALFKRAAELQETGLSQGVALEVAELEARIAHWPASWGGDLHVLIYGDFFAPDHDLEYPMLGITVGAGRRTDTIIKTALCVVNARVKVSEKSLSGVLDAAARLNTFLGLWTILDRGNRSVGWWCYLTSQGLGGAWGPFKKKGIEEALGGLARLPPKVKRKVRAALHWIREPKHMALERFRNDILHVYAGYWNAFECLVEAVCLIRPQTKMTKQERRDGILRYLAERQGKLDVASLSECYRLFGDPGFVAKASHALRVCCSDRAEGYIVECFRAKPEKERLYAVRNAINHGDIDSDSLQEMYRVGDKLGRLQTIVFGMLGRLIPLSCPVDSGPS